MEKRIYLDNAATSWPKPNGVIEAMSYFLRDQGCNPGRGGYECSLEAGREVLQARETVCEFLGGSSLENVVFSHNVTQALNFALYGLLRKGDHVITSDLEHNAVWRPLKTMEKEGLITLSVYPFAQNGFVKDEFLKLFETRTKMVIINHASNITGQILPIEQIGAITAEKGVFFAVDTAQTAGSVPINAENTGIDITAFTGHKGLFGPPGTGGMVLSQKAAEEIRPIFQGGTGSISHLEYQPEFLPDKLESGTPNTPGLIGLRQGIEFILEKGISQVNSKKQSLVGLLARGLENLPGVKITGGYDEASVATLSITVQGRDPAILAYQLGEEGIMVRAGLHCCPAGHRALKTYPQGALRFSPGFFNTKDEIETVIQILGRLILENN